MSRFVQLHVLTHYPPSNLNRDDTGRPKTALMGGALRLRVSSQSQKRAWRMSEAFEAALAGQLGTRTKRLGVEVFKEFKDAGVADKQAREWAREIAQCFGKLEEKKSKDAPKDEKEDGGKKDDYTDLCISQLAHISPEERAAIDVLVQECAKRKSGPEKEELSLLGKPRQAVDIAMFGRMLADASHYNVEAAVQVAHAVTVHKAAVEDDYFTAVDDLNNGLGEQGAAHIGERGYGAGLFYVYVCIDRELLRNNLGGDDVLTRKALHALLHAMTKTSPTGMQASFASRAYASYVLAEKGAQQPRSLSQAFLRPIEAWRDKSLLEEAVSALEKQYQKFDTVYGACADDRKKIDVEAGQGSLDELVAFVQE